MSVLHVAASLGVWSRALRAWVVDHDAALDVVLVRDRFAASAAAVQVACLDASAPWVDRELLAGLRARGVVVVGVYRHGDDESRWIDWGVADRMSATLSPADMAFLLTRLNRRTRGAPAAPGKLVELRHRRTTRLPLVFGGPPGAGAREVALSAADVLADRFATVVIDVNEQGDGVGRRLGYGISPNVLAFSRGICPPVSIRELSGARLGGGVEVGFDVIPGLPSAADWRDWTPAHAAGVVEAARDEWTSVVVTTSPLIEDLRRWGDRFAVSRTLLSSPGVRVVGVVEASPRGVIRFAEWFADAQPAHPVTVVLNKAPPRQPRSAVEVRDRLRALIDEELIGCVGVLPFDPHVARAEWDGVLPRRGPFARAVRRLRPVWNEIATSEVGAVV